MGTCISVFAQAFADQAAIERYAALMDEVADLIVGRYDGSLKAEPRHRPATWRPSSRWNGGSRRPSDVAHQAGCSDPSGLLNPESWLPTPTLRFT